MSFHVRIGSESDAPTRERQKDSAVNQNGRDEKLSHVKDEFGRRRNCVLVLILSQKIGMFQSDLMSWKQVQRRTLR
jgi:hypothetical protein